MSAVSFYAGMHAEYFSASYNEWIECRVALVRPDGCLKLEHIDGTGVLKESADQTKVRPHASEREKAGVDNGGGPPPKPGAARRSVNGGPPTPVRQPAGVAPKKSPPPGRAASPGLGGEGTPSSAVRRASPAPAGPKVNAAPAGPKAAVGTPRGPPSARPPAGGAAPVKSLDGTISPKPLYVGDRVKLKGSNRCGEVMYVGPATFAGGDTVVGIKLDEKRTTSDCDGKHKGERYFRCSPGNGLYQSMDEVEVIPPELADEDVRSLVVSDAPDAEAFDLEKELEGLVGLREVKDAIRHARNFIEVQRRRCSVVGDSTVRAVHFAFLQGGPGSGASTVAQLLGGMLLKLGVLAKGHVVEATRKDLLAGCSSGDLEGRLKKVVKAGEGGVLLLHDVDGLKESDHRLGEEAMQAIGKQCESAGGNTEWPQRICLVLAGKRGELQKCLTEYPSIGSAVFAKLDFMDLGPQEVGLILRKLVEAHKFQLSNDLTDERLEALVRRRMAGSGPGGQAPKNVRLAKALLEEAVSRQTDRVYAKETLSYAGLTTLVEDDFVDRSREENEAAQAALRKMDSVVGLRPVKEFVHSLYAQLQLEKQKRELGIDSRGSSSTLHMVFTGNPGTGKTTVARVVADLLKALGLLRTGHMIEADRSALVAGYSGQTALKTKAVVESALGGVLFVDEAYALVGEDGKDSFGREALDTLIKLVEDYRSDLVVIIAGYSKEMEKLLDTNPGLRSRFPTVLEFNDYSPEELLEIADQMLLQDVLLLSQAASERLRCLLQEVNCGSGPKSGDARAAGNGRAVRNVLERAKRNQAVRLQRGAVPQTQEEICMLLPEDFDS
mmetsp:Transcript_43939/g.135783  ORF Transcript_43939/g.135783 Transcript_43939/m.135783 type:complete len:835 (+) Transcript_43939:122-2626(+)